ncbi:Glycosyl hydrolase family 1 [Musa troglodytarum]|uniref:Glycosyl hydrolase family 1 n=1 Tax=Musa troglodytarum TaxID=320322 RepID=A0A9E7ELT2_9LILI|nr:Glycosyl hydrolase family 1 [Musa troglodytarum]
MVSPRQPSGGWVTLRVSHPHHQTTFKMCSIRFSSFFSCVVPLLSLLSIGNPRFAAGAHQLNRDAFPEGFVFGTAASAYQVEGMALKGGRGPSIWDAFVRIRKFYSFVLVTAGMIPNNATADVSVDEYHHYKEDIDIMKKFNFDAYRFSISWSRIFPNGTGSINWEGVDYYDRLIDYLILQGITPYANLYHYDLPLALHKEYLGWLSPKIAHSGWLYIVPWGMYKAVTYVKVNYGDPVIILAENGNVTLPEGLRDTKRINYYRSYITELKRRSMMVRR